MQRSASCTSQRDSRSVDRGAEKVEYCIDVRTTGRKHNYSMVAKTTPGSALYRSNAPGCFSKGPFRDQNIDLHPAKYCTDLFCPCENPDWPQREGSLSGRLAILRFLAPPLQCSRLARLVLMLARVFSSVWQTSLRSKRDCVGAKAEVHTY